MYIFEICIFFKFVYFFLRDEKILDCTTIMVQIPLQTFGQK